MACLVLLANCVTTSNLLLQSSMLHRTLCTTGSTEATKSGGALTLPATFVTYNVHRPWLVPGICVQGELRDGGTGPLDSDSAWTTLSIRGLKAEARWSGITRAIRRMEYKIIITIPFEPISEFLPSLGKWTLFLRGESKWKRVCWVFIKLC